MFFNLQLIQMGNKKIKITLKPPFTFILEIVIQLLVLNDEIVIISLQIDGKWRFYFKILNLLYADR